MRSTKTAHQRRSRLPQRHSSNAPSLTQKRPGASRGGLRFLEGGAAVITYVVRRLLYSIPVLVAASLLIFFSVSAMGDPLAELKINPLLSKQTVHNIEQRNHLDKPIIVQYGYWVKTAVTDKFGSPLLIKMPSLVAM